MDTGSSLIFPETGPDLIALLEERLTPGAAQCIRAVRECSQRTGVSACLVGGSVRDLLLGKSIVDLDVVVEGDGIAFAQELAGLENRDMVPFSRFGTAFVILPPGIKVDIATARRESYPEPGLLPEVEPATLDEDLLRRDFTINAMAIRLGPAGYGTFIDQHGGCRDLRAGIIRVLHDDSFRDDPTRILRAVRFRTRLQYAFDDTTEELLVQAVQTGMLDEVSRQRIREEIVAILTEDEAAHSLASLSITGIWNALFKYDIILPEATGDLFQRGHEALKWYRDLAQDHGLAEVETWVVRWLLLAGKSPAATFIRVSRHFHMGRAVNRAARDRLDRYPFALAILLDDSRRTDSALYRSLSALGPESIVLLAGEGGRRARAGLEHFITRLMVMEPFVDGHDLKAMKVAKGPLVGEILGQVFTAQLDGAVQTRAEALELAKRLAATSGKGR
ncbi:CCA tRNA nucleotidyltransferase [Gemmatimonadota bacterium]